MSKKALDAEVLKSMEPYLKTYDERMEQINAIFTQLKEATPENIDKKLKAAIKSLRDVQLKYKFDPKIFK